MIDELLDKKVDVGNNCMAANGTMYRTDKQGLLPRIIQREYDDKFDFKYG